MKRILALIVAFALLLSGVALSEAVAPPNVQPEGLGSKTGGMPTVVAQLGGTLYYTVPTGDSAGGQAGPSNLWESGDGSLVKRAETYSGAVYVEKDGAIYFLSTGDSSALMALDTASGQITQAADLGFENAKLTASLKGLMVSGLIEVGVYANRLFDRKTGTLLPSDIDPTGEYHSFGRFETLETSQGGLKMRTRGGAAWQAVYAGQASGQAELDGALYYLVPQTYMESAYVEVYRYDPAVGKSAYVAQADGQFTGQMLTGGGLIALVGPAGVLVIDPVSGASEPLYQPEAALIDPALVQVGDTLYLYARPDAESPQQFVLSLSLTREAPRPTPQPTPELERDLARGSRGEDVLKLQMYLNDLGYAAGKEDGVYGVSTYGAVRYFQDALGVSQTGKATVDLRHTLYAGSAPEFVEFVALTSGSRGIRVEALQTRLRALGYTAAKVDGSFGKRTIDAVKLFQKEVGLKQTGEASVQVLKKLMSSGAPRCSSYITLKKGDSGDRVEMLQGRLKVLGYYAGSASSSFDDRTATAVRISQGTIGLTVDGVAGAKLQQRLFAARAPKCDQFIELRYGDSGPRVKELQTQLQKLGYFGGSIGGNFATQTQSAVKAFQRDMGLKPTGIATVSLQEALYAFGIVTPWPRPTLRPTPRPTKWPTPKPTPRPTLRPRPTPRPTPTSSGQVITNAAVDDLVKLLNSQSPTPKVKYTRRTAVLWLQKKLTQMDYFDAFDGDNSGVYDRPTFNAVKKFQKDMGISLSAQNYGYVRQKTFDAIIEYSGTWVNPGDPIDR